MKQSVLLALILIASNNLFSQETINHYVFFNIDRHRIQEESFIESKALNGAQLKYRWSELEPEKGIYNFELIQNDLDFLKAKGKGLFIQIQDVSFDTSIINVPKYLLEDSIYNGGAEIMIGRNDDGIYEIEGLVARRWDINVANRFHALLKELGRRFDGEITGINLAETSIGLGTADMHPKGFSYESYFDAVKNNMLVLKGAFPSSTAILYANFMPGDNFPLGKQSYLTRIYDFAELIGVGMGGPDIKVFKYWQMEHSYKLMQETKDISLGVAVQWGNYDLINPKTNQKVTIDDIYRFAKDELGLDYIFWSTQEPYYTGSVLPYLNETFANKKETTLKTISY